MFVKIVATVAFCVVLNVAFSLGHHHGAPMSKFFFPGYEKSLRPLHGSGNSVNVTVNTFIRFVGDLCLHKQEFTAQLTFRQEYEDPRLRHDEEEPITLHGHEMDAIWQPDTFFRQSKNGIDVLDGYATVTSDGSVRLSQRFNIRFFCFGLRDGLELYGRANCDMEIASYGHQGKDLAYTWKVFDKDAIRIGAESAFMPPGVELGDLSGAESFVVFENPRRSYSTLSIKFPFSGNVEDEDDD